MILDTVRMLLLHHGYTPKVSDDAYLTHLIDSVIREIQSYCHLQ